MILKPLHGPPTWRQHGTLFQLRTMASYLEKLLIPTTSHTLTHTQLRAVPVKAGGHSLIKPTGPQRLQKPRPTTSTPLTFCPYWLCTESVTAFLKNKLLTGPSQLASMRRKTIISKSSMSAVVCQLKSMPDLNSSSGQLERAESYCQSLQKHPHLSVTV